MKVALVCDWYHPRVGGIELHLQDLAQRLTAAGHDVVVVTPTPGADVIDGIRVRRVETPLAPRFGFLWTPAGIRAVGDVLRSERPDVAHCHVSIVSPAALGGAFQASHMRIPTALTLHSIVPRTELLARAANAVLGISDLAASVSAVSERVARDVRVLAGRRTMTVVPNGIDVDFWRGGPPPRVDEECRIVSVMRLNAKKRPLALVDVMRQLSLLLPATARYSLRIVGDGPMLGPLSRAIARARLGDRIELLGARSREQIRDLLVTSDLFVLPTVRESFGLAALEARCAGLPVVAMKSSGVAEFVRHGESGLLARSDRELAAQVGALIIDPLRRRELAQHNRETVPPYDWPIVLAAHVALYREAIALRDSVCAER